MKAREPEVIVPCRNLLGESPTWSHREQALYWVDIRGRVLHRFEPASRSHRHWIMPELCSAVVLAKDGLIVAWERSLRYFDVQLGETNYLADIEPLDLANRLNEAKADRQGRLWVGSMRDFGAAVSGALYCLTTPPLAKRVFSDICIPNSLSWSPDNRTMYFADTADGALRAYDYDWETGTPMNVRILVPNGELPGRPDGCTVDAEGFLWNARYGAGCVVRIAPNGRAVSSIKLPVAQPTSCTLGGPDFRKLFITTAAQQLNAAERMKQPFAGHLFAVDVDVPGMPDGEFALQ